MMSKDKKAAEGPLPEILPLFVHPSIMLLPRGHLPLNLFESRYIAMIDDVLATPSRLIGIVQQREAQTQDERPLLYEIGCAGRISSFAETDRGTYLISLRGVCRFTISEEVASEKTYRQVRPQWRNFVSDLNEPKQGLIERDRLFAALRHYFRQHSIAANWEVIQETSDDHLITSLAMTCPLAPWEQQALLEAPNLAERAKLLLILVEMATLEGQGAADMVRH
jgi:uncharacterized protein